MGIVNFLMDPIFPASVKTFDGYNDWPPLWVFILAVFVIFIITRYTPEE